MTPGGISGITNGYLASLGSLTYGAGVLSRVCNPWETSAVKPKLQGFLNSGVTGGRIQDGFHVAVAGAPTFGGAISLCDRCSPFSTLQLLCVSSGSPVVCSVFSQCL
jgi:hypothetical protein